MIISIILAGGIGKRLWPLSKTNRPKQFLKFFDFESSFQESIRNSRNIHNGPIVIVANITHQSIIEEQILSKDNIHIIYEKETNDTAVAITIALLYIKSKFLDPYILVLPSDHMIENINILKVEIDQLKFVHTKHLNIFGIKPSKTNKSYGYIKKGQRSHFKANLYNVEQFIEKPTNAHIYTDNGDYLWNIGIIFGKSSQFIKSLKEISKNLIRQTEDSIKSALYIDNNSAIIDYKDSIGKVKSIDYFLLEHSEKLYVSEIDLLWRDIGSWHSLLNIINDDKNYNNIEFSNHNIFNNSSIMPEAKPWGDHRIINQGENYQIKILDIEAGNKTSLQTHQFRDEKLIIINGTAKITIDEIVSIFTYQDEIIIKQGMKHRIENIGTELLTILEIQTGTILIEDDIIRFEDDYGREKFSDVNIF